MSNFTKYMVDIASPVDAAGNPRRVPNGEMQVWGTEVERLIQIATSNGDLLVYGSLSALNADLDHAAHTGAILIGDSITDDGLYMKQGASGAGSWVKIGNVPGQGFVKATNAGAGAANAIAATTPVAVNETQLILLPITTANTASPVTVAFNGGAALTVKTVSGNDLAVGGLPAGSVMLGAVQGGDFRLLSDQASVAIQAAAEAAQTAAEQAQTAAESAAGANLSNADSRASAVLTNIPPPVNYVRTAGYFLAGDGGSALYKKVASQPSHGGKFQSSDGAWWETAATEVNVKQFGAKGDGGADDTAAIQAAIDFLPASGDDPNHYDRGATLIFPTGTYRLSNELVVDKNVSLVGLGNTRFVGDVSSSPHKCAIFFGDSSYLTNTSGGYWRILVSNLNLAGISGHECAIRSHGVRTITVERTTVAAGSVGSMEFVGAWSTSKVRDCWFQGGGFSGLRILENSNAFEIVGNRFAGYQHNGSTGLSLFVRGAMGVWVHNNDFEYSHRHIYAQSTTETNCNNLVIRDNWIEGAVDGSIFLDNDAGGFNAFTIAGNSIWGNPNGDVYLGNTGATGVFEGGLVMGNTFNSPTWIHRRSDSALYRAIVQQGNYPQSVNV